ncbi:hypothetical protein BYT27DRAFT_7196627 [Phlegmacium glaucopus]|nr:hypothetical protein BYT27DRAFT_7196627 [Phlegmacium glaucopus]
MSKATEKPDKDSELGTLIIVLLKARNLNDKHSFRKQDVVAQATLNGVQKRSHVDVRGGQHPEWDSEVRFTVLKGNGPGGKNRKLEVACYSQESKSEDLLGKATVDISDTLNTGEFDDWVSLDIDGVIRGDIYLEMTYYAKAPVPIAAPKNKRLAPVQENTLGRRPSKLSPSNRLSRPVQKNAAGPSSFPPKQPSQLRDQSNPTSPHLYNAIRKNDSLPASLADEPVHSSAALLNTRDLRSLSPPLAVLPSVLRPGSGGPSSPIPISNAGQRRDFGHSRTPSESSTSSNNRLHSTTPDVSLSPPNPYTGGSGTYTPVQTGLSNIDGPSSLNPYTGGSGAYTAAQQYQQAHGGRAYSPVPPGAFMENQPGPDGRSYSPNHDGAVSLNPYTGGSGTLVSGGQHPQTSGGRAYSPVPPTVSLQVSGPSHSSVPVSASPPNQYAGNGSVYLPESQLGPYLTYSPAPASKIDHSVPTDSYTGGSGTFIPGHQQAPDGRAYSYAPPVNTAQTSGYANYVTSLQGPSGPSLPYNTGMGGSATNVPSGPLAFPMPTIPVVVMEPYGHHEPSSFMRPGLGGRPESSSYYQPPLPPRMNPASNNQSEYEEAPDPHHLARYQTPLPLPPGSVKESPLPPPPLPPPLAPAIATPTPLPPPPPAPAVATLTPLPPPPAPTMATPAQVPSPPPAVVVPNTARVEALRKVEQDAAKRREQELKDLELAMELDRELNL